jgi:hypothetical protein
VVRTTAGSPRAERGLEGSLTARALRVETILTSGGSGWCGGPLATVSGSVPSAGPIWPGAVLSIGSGRGTSVAELVAAFAAVSGHRGEVRFDGAASVRSAAVPWQRSDVSAAAAVLGWRPRIDLRTSLAQLWRKSDSCTISGSSRGR